jgi:hypothetical protein
MPTVGAQRKQAMMTSSIKKHWETGYCRPPSRRSEFGLVERDAPVEQVRAVAVTVAKGDAEHPWRH